VPHEHRYKLDGDGEGAAPCRRLRLTKPDSTAPSSHHGLGHGQGLRFEVKVTDPEPGHLALPQAVDRPEVGHRAEVTDAAQRVGQPRELVGIDDVSPQRRAAGRTTFWALAMCARNGTYLESLWGVSTT
jgi:hypothetical protein